MSSYENSRTPQKEPLDYMREAQVRIFILIKYVVLRKVICFVGVHKFTILLD